LIVEKISLDLNIALKEGDKEKVSVLRMVKSDLKNEEINKKHPLSDEEAYMVLEKLLRQRRDAFLLYEKANRLELIAKEKKEMVIINSYLPKKMSEEEIRCEVIFAMKNINDKDFGKVMGMTMSKLKGRADGSLVSRIVREELK